MQVFRELWWLWVFVGVVALYVVFAFVPFVLVKQVPELAETSVNELGDSFGVANAFFSSLAFAGVVVTLVLQMQELKAQREEMVEMQRVQMLAIYLENERATASPSSERRFDFATAYPELIKRFLNAHVKAYLKNNNPFHFLDLVFMLRQRIEDQDLVSLKDTEKDRWTVTDVFMGLAALSSPFEDAVSLDGPEKEFIRSLKMTSVYCFLAHCKQVDTPSLVRAAVTITKLLEDIMTGKLDSSSGLEVLRTIETDTQRWLTMPYRDN